MYLVHAAYQHVQGLLSTDVVHVSCTWSAWCVNWCLHCTLHGTCILQCRGIYSYGINFVHFHTLYWDSVLNVILCENLCSNLVCTFSMSVTYSCTICCTILHVYIDQCTKYCDAWENFQLYSLLTARPALWQHCTLYNDTPGLFEKAVCMAYSNQAYLKYDIVLYVIRVFILIL